MDPLSDVIALLRPSTAISKPITGRGRWGVRYAAHDAPGFTIIPQPECWITFEGQDPVRFGKEDFALLPSTPPFPLRSHSGQQAIEGFTGPSVHELGLFGIRASLSN